MSEIIKEGWATKLGGFFKTWRRRWFILSQDKLRYFKEKSGRMMGEIPLNAVTEIDEYPQCIKQPAFKVVIPNVRTYQIFTDTETERDEWVSALKKAVKDLNEPDVTVSIDDFDILKVLGKGAYGKVQLVRHKKTNVIYAMKSISKKLLDEYDLVQRTLAEREVLLNSNHPFLVSARFCFQTDTKIFLVLDYVPGGELFSRLREERKFKERRTKLYIAQLVLAIGHLHKMGVIHRDLKPENILIDKDGYIKLTDFGLVKVGLKKEGVTSTFCGTPEYIAPEMIEGEEYGMAVDWWALGTLTYEMLFGIPPFYDTNTNAMYRSIVRSEIEFPPEASPLASDFISRLLDKNPGTRLGSGPTGSEEIKSHGFFVGVDWDALLNRTIPMEWKPEINSLLDVSQFDTVFTQEKPKLTYEDPSLVGSQVQRQLQGFTFTEEGQQ